MKNNLKLRYYSPHYKKEVHEQILVLLQQIKDKHNIDFEIVNLTMIKSQYGPDSYPEEDHEKEIYESEFKPRSKILQQRTGESIRRMLRSHSGSYFIAGVVSIIKDGQVEWYTHYTERFKKFSDDNTLGFLKLLLEEGTRFLADLTPDVKSLIKHETSLLDRFISSGTLKGQFKREVRVGSKVFETNQYGRRTVFDYRKSIDAVCRTDDGVWILEAKRILNYEAIGGVLTYSYLYKKENPAEKIRWGIVCGEVDEELLEVCKEYQVKVFKVTVNEVNSW